MEMGTEQMPCCLMCSANADASCSRRLLRRGRDSRSFPGVRGADMLPDVSVSAVHFCGEGDGGESFFREGESFFRCSGVMFVLVTDLLTEFKRTSDFPSWIFRSRFLSLGFVFGSLSGCGGLTPARRPSLLNDL